MNIKVDDSGGVSWKKGMKEKTSFKFPELIKPGKPYINENIIEVLLSKNIEDKDLKELYDSAKGIDNEWYMDRFILYQTFLDKKCIFENREKVDQPINQNIFKTFESKIINNDSKKIAVDKSSEVVDCFLKGEKYTKKQFEKIKSSYQKGWLKHYYKLINMMFDKNISIWIPEKYSKENELTDKIGENNIMHKSTIPLNQILYGPPGTGKTYNTINVALKILEPKCVQENEKRSKLKEKFDNYIKEGRIGFVTFHQSFSYEDFVEGLRADADEDGNIQYSVQDGIFKQLCEKAEKDDNSIAVDEAINELIEKIESEPLHLQTSRGKGFTVTYRGGITFRIKPDSSDNLTDYPASIENIKKVFRGFNTKEVYNPSYVLSILEYLKSNFDLKDKSEISKVQKPVVLIIDEINRGNTANIFGELITLIEESKRMGADEALSVVLPYSKEPFSVPNNLYIIGTMNTADRSLALIDTALRRRFQFEEILPNPSLLSEIEFEGINIQELLTVMNKRIALLYDREHTLGHSFFMSLDKSSTVNDLKNIFNRQVLPLLEEYFFEDWGKIRQVLGDQFKADEDLQIIKPEIENSEVSDLLGDTNNNNILNSLYTRNDKALSNSKAYIAIYKRE